MEDLRRTVEELKTACIMDPHRRDLYVEGEWDQAMITYIRDVERNAYQSRVLPISSVEIDTPTLGGNRSRCLQLAENLEGIPQYKVFVDADYDIYFGRELPSQVWFTDFHDMESYLIDLELFRKVVTVALSRVDVSPESIFENVVDVCLKLAAMRICSIRRGYNLPFQRLRMNKHLEGGGRRAVMLNAHSTARALFQNANLSISGVGDFLAEAGGLEGSLRGNILYVIHGHDLGAVTDYVLFGKVTLENRSMELLRAAMNPSILLGHERMRAVVEWLRVTV